MVLLVVIKLCDAGGVESVNALTIVVRRARRRKENLIVLNAKTKKEGYGVKAAVCSIMFVSSD